MRPPRFYNTRWLARLVTGLVVAYDTGLAGLYILHAVVRHDGPWWLAFISVWQPWWYAPLIALIPLALLAVRPRRLQFALLAIPAVLWVGTFGRLFWPKPTPPAPAELTVMTFNIRFDQHANAQVLAAIQNAAPDVVALQELTTDLDAWLWTRLQADYPYRLSASADAPWGFGLFSRFPLTLIENRAWTGGLTDTQDTWLDWHGTRVRLINFHPVPPKLYLAESAGLPLPYNYEADTRHEQVADLVQRLNALSGPLIVACDCNMDPASHDYAQMTQPLQDSFLEAGWGFGNTLYNNDSPNLIQNIPLVRIDYIFHSPHWRALAARVLPWASSNHRPVVATLAIR